MKDINKQRAYFKSAAAVCYFFAEQDILLDSFDFCFYAGEAHGEITYGMVFTVSLIFSVDGNTIEIKRNISWDKAEQDTQAMLQAVKKEIEAI